MKHLLIIYHSQGGKTQRMADSVFAGACHEDIDAVETRFLRALEAGLDDLLWADALIIGSPENFGYMAGAIKDFLDRTFYPAQGKVEGLPYSVFVCAGNDGTGAVTSIQRIARGYPFREVQEPLVCRGDVTPDVVTRCEEFGMTMAAGLEIGAF